MFVVLNSIYLTLSKSMCEQSEARMVFLMEKSGPVIVYDVTSVPYNLIDSN